MLATRLLGQQSLWLVRDISWCSPLKSVFVLYRRNRQKSPLLTETGLLQPDIHGLDAGDLAEAGRAILQRQVSGV